MIVVRTSGEVEWLLLPTDELTVKTADGEATFKVADIVDVVVEGFDIMVGDGKKNGADIRAMRVTDQNSGVAISFVLPLDVAEGVGSRLAKKTIQVVGSMPTDLPKL